MMDRLSPHRQGRRAAGFGATSAEMPGVRIWVTTSAVALALFWSATGTIVRAATPMKVTVRSVDEANEVATVPLGKSIVIELDKPTTRVAIGNDQIATIEVLTPHQVLVTGKAVGMTRLFIWGDDGQQRIVDISVELETQQLQAAIKRSFPHAHVEARSILDTIVLTGTVPSADAAEQIEQLAEVFSPKVRNHLQVAGLQQILIRCTVAEVSKAAIRQLGVNGWIAGDNIRDVFAVNQLDGINPANIGAGPVANIIQPGGIPFATAENGLVLNPTPTTFSLGFPRVQMQLFFRALRENQLLRILAEPNLVSIAGEEATFLVGGEFPVPVPQSSGTGGVTITIEWKPFGVQLNFTGAPVGRDLIRLRVAPEVSEQDFTRAITTQGFVIPALTQRRAETTIELATGSTIAIAGLLSEQARATARKVPALGDVPVLGALFSSVEYQRNQTELVILVTPELVTAMTPEQVPAVPGQNQTVPNDWELFGLGLLEGEPIAEPDEREQSVKTDVLPRGRKWTAPPTQMSLHGPWGMADGSEAVE